MDKTPPSAAQPGEAAAKWLADLCSVAPDRRPGSEGNRHATALVAEGLASAGWAAQRQPFSCTDWETSGGSVWIDAAEHPVEPTPYGLGVDGSGPIRVVRTLEDLGAADLAGTILVLDGPIANTPLTPRDFPFYASDEHTRILDRLETANPLAVIAVTGKYPELCGALEPFPLIEDGRFGAPSAAVTAERAIPLLRAEGEVVSISIASHRWEAQAENVIARRGPHERRVLVVAHVDSKPGTPGAVDNAAGVVCVLLLAHLLAPSRHPALPVGVELLAVNGEDHFAAPGEQAWLAANDDRLEQIGLVINIDGAGYRRGATAYSTYNLEPKMERWVDDIMSLSPGLVRGPEWFQSDHAIFAMRGRPAMAFTSERLDLMLSEVYHAATDTVDQVSIPRLREIAGSISEVILRWGDLDQA